jgi:arginyl-tRNA synthetase
MIVEQLRTMKVEDLSTVKLQTVYCSAKESFENDPEFAERARQRTYEIQNKSDPCTYKMWQDICSVSRNAYNKIYDKLGVKIDEVGESFYYPFIDGVISELKTKNLLTLDEGRYIIKTNHGTLTLIKSDGSYTYDTTDMTALKYRLCTVIADRVFYVVDSGQSLHFKQLFDAAHKASWLTNQELEHVNFGVVTGEGGKRIKSRDGNTPKLSELLDEATVKAAEFIDKHNKECQDRKQVNLTDQEIQHIAYGSVKYADLATPRVNDYAFSYSRMLNFKGNTLLYIMYSSIRCKSICDKVDQLCDKSVVNCIFNVGSVEECDVELLNQLFMFGNTIDTVIKTKHPHHLCSYLYKLSDTLNPYYNKVRCMSFDSDNKLKSVDLTKVKIFKLINKVYGTVFKLLGIVPLTHL